MNTMNHSFFRKLIYAATIAVSLFTAGCKDGNKLNSGLFSSSLYEEEEFAPLVQQLTSTDPSSLLSLYEGRSKGIWIAPDGNIDAAETLLQQMSDLADEGLPIQRYRHADLNKQLEQFKNSDETWTVHQVFTLDTLLSSSYIKASHDLLFGVLNPEWIDEEWYVENDSTLHLNSSISMDSLFDKHRSTIPTYTILKNELQRIRSLKKDSVFLQLQTLNRDSTRSIEQLIGKWTNNFTDRNDTSRGEQKIIRSFQKYVGLRPTGKLDSSTKQHLLGSTDYLEQKILANLERLRWLPKELTSNHFLVVTPMQQLCVQHNGALLTVRNVIIGKPSRETPSLNQSLQNIVYNPSWGVPPTIKKQDIIPGIARKGAAYLAKKGLKAYDSQGRLVENVSVINKGNMHRFHFKQPPGSRNALGNVKFNMPNELDIYLHDTPEKYAFNNTNRALSSGCIRVENPLDLSELVLNTMDDQRVSLTTIDSIVQSRRTTQIDVKQPIEVYIVYLTAFTSDFNRGHINFYKDVYQKDAKLIAELQKF